MNAAAAARTPPDPWSLPLETMDPSDGALFQSGAVHEWFRRLRAEYPIHWSPTGPSGPYWSITRFDDIVAIDSNHKIFSSHANVAIGDKPAEYADSSFIAADQPRHDWQRKAVNSGVGPTRLAEMEALVRSRTAATLDALPVGETFDWVREVSIELTTQMLATMFDFPFEERHLLTHWSDVITSSEALGAATMDQAERWRIMNEFLARFTALWRERAAKPPTMDFISLLAHNPATAGMVDEPRDFIGNLALLIVGGNDTTRNTMSGGVVFLNRFPGEWDKLRANPALVTSMVPEIIRLQTPIAHMRRTALEDHEIGGKTIRKGDRVVMWYVSGNRDETVIERPDEFIIDRANPRHHLSFGFGIHRCMGNRMAEMQVRILWEELLTRFSRIEMMGEPQRTFGNMIQGYTNLPVRLHA